MPLTPAQEWAYWDGRATELRHGQLKTVQEAASAWSKLFSAVLAVFGTVAFAGGFTTLDKLAQPWSGVAKALTLAAAIAALFATIWSARASQDLAPGVSTGVDAATLRARAVVAAAESLKRFNKAKVAGVVAASIVLLGSMMILFAPGSEPGPVKLLILKDGALHCGELTSKEDGLLLGALSLSRGVESVTVLPDCP